ncbi:type 4a pilus biogenesis protein PilO [Vibrio sp. ZSDZ34]|jgi:type IV pilus assembly protein PilO|uniref:Type 4a pilus biogenesis protein PilO n=1 Tax=Vibrio gelatinilyticus TaxID=2893468 RepID=A0A9X1WD95_9VIBR|nr:type 4a pilus biogenesis protein PilO [Vibrio gelatinilyticus]MCJ2378787.1 type 4a pilus biogenesis protein PilO [Vibrio gelatinilyticus]
MDLSDFEWDELPYWSWTMRGACLSLLLMVLLAAFSWMIVYPGYAELNQEKLREHMLLNNLRHSAKKAAMLPQLQVQLSDLNNRYDHLMQQLPVQKELASLLAAVNEEGVKQSLIFTRIDWGKWHSSELLNELPLDIELTGDYQNIGYYVEAIAALPRIVLFEDAEWQRVSQESSTLHFRVRAYTYQLNFQVGTP